MLNIWRDSIYKHLHLMFRASLDQGAFPLCWKKANVAPIHKKTDKQSINNHRPVCRLSIFGKILSRLLYNKILSFFIEIDGWEVRCVLFDISQAFDQVGLSSRRTI